MKDEVYCYKRRIEGLLRRVKASRIPEESKRKILDFYRECVLRGYSKARTIKYIDTLERIARALGKPFSQVDKRDIENLIAEIEQKGYTEWTKHDYKVILRVFYRWFKKNEYPEEVSWIKIKGSGNHKLPEELLSFEEVLQMVNAADHVRDKAFILTLYESG
ncbi:MAG: hypothetical protein ACPLZG_12575, partial [Thermoproteota archaeon]